VASKLPEQEVVSRTLAQLNTMFGAAAPLSNQHLVCGSKQQSELAGRRTQYSMLALLALTYVVICLAQAVSRSHSQPPMPSSRPRWWTGASGGMRWAATAAHPSVSLYLAGHAGQLVMCWR
jgi:hypothetical protein